MSEGHDYSLGFLGNQTVVLKDGLVMPPEEIVELLNAQEAQMAMLKSKEWVWCADDDRYHNRAGYYCSECGMPKEVGHNPNCELAMILNTKQPYSDIVSDGGMDPRNRNGI